MSAKDETLPRENPWISLIANIVLPVVILNKLSETLGPAKALVLALAFPLAYGGWDLWRRKKVNFISLLGILNTLITGGLALLGVAGLWFAVKEAAFPLLLGIFIFASAGTSKPAIGLLLLNPNVFHLDRLQQRVKDLGAEGDFKALVISSTRWLAGSFFLSAVLNFVLASRIFLPIPQDLDEGARSIRLNEQIADMHQWSFLVILAPSMIFLMSIFYVVVRRLKQITGLRDDEIFRIS